MQIQTKLPTDNGWIIKSLTFSAYLAVLVLFLIEVNDPWSLFRRGDTSQLDVLSSMALGILVFILGLLTTEKFALLFLNREDIGTSNGLAGSRLYAYVINPLMGTAFLFVMARQSLEKIIFKRVDFQPDMTDPTHVEFLGVLLSGKMSDLDSVPPIRGSGIVVDSAADMAQNALGVFHANPVIFCLWFLLAAVLAFFIKQDIQRCRKQSAATAVENQSA